MGYSTLQKLTAICAISATVPAASALAAAVDAAHVFGLIGRDTCTSNNLTSCGPSLPSGWCCPQSTVCMSLNNTGTQSALCCPNGSNCGQIEPISCNITLQDPSKFPSAVVHTQDLSKTLPTCGNNCCPLGYECNSAGNCQILNTTTEAPISSASTGSSTASATSLSSSSTSTSTGTTVPANAIPTPVSNSGFSGRSFAAGFIPGLVLGILLTVALIFILIRRKKRTSPGSIFNEKPDRQISDPIYHPQFAARTDFLHKRTISEPAPSVTLVSTPPEAFQGYYDPRIRAPAKRSPASSDSLGGSGSLGPPFDTPTPMPKHLTKNVMDRDSPSTPPMRVRGLFSAKSPSLRRKKSTYSLSRNASDKRSDVSEATIDVRMSHGTPGFGLPPIGQAQGRQFYPPAVAKSRTGPAPESDGTTYSDVLRAIGVEGTPAKLGSPYRGK